MQKIRRDIDRLISSNLGNQALLFAIIFVVSLLVIASLYWIAGVGHGFVDSTIKAISDFFSGDQFSMYSYQANRSVSPIVKGVTLLACFIGVVVLQGLLIATITNVIYSRADKVRQGAVYYSFSDHVLVLGYNDSVPSIVRKYCDQGTDVVILVPTNAQEIRDRLYGTTGKRNNCFVLRGDMTNAECLKSLHVGKATSVYILGEDNLPDNDARNLDCYHAINNELKANVGCYVLFGNRMVYDNIIHNYSNSIQHFHPFNAEELWARRLLVDSANQYGKLDYRSEADNIGVHPDKRVHLVIMGMSPMGEALFIETLMLAHYPNYLSHNVRTLITCIDSNMQQRMKAFAGRYKSLFDSFSFSTEERGHEDAAAPTMSIARCIPRHSYIDVEFEFIEADMQDLSTMRMVEAWADDDSRFLSVAICGDDDVSNYAVGCSLPSVVYSHNIPVFLYQRSQHKGYGAASIPKCVQSFGYSDIDITADCIELQWGKWVNYIYNQLYSEESVSTTSMEADVNKLWDALSLDKRWSNIYNASSIFYKLRGLGIYDMHQLKSGTQVVLGHLESLSEVEHNRWNVEQLIHRYRPTTPEEHQAIVADPKKKKIYKLHFIHDDIRPYSELDEYTKSKDRELIKYLTSLMVNAPIA